MDTDPVSEVAALGEEIWAWRRVQQPASPDDIPRLARPEGWHPDFSPDAVALYRAQREDLSRRWARIEVSLLPVADAVDHRLLGSVLARVVWELDVVQSWRRDPLFHVHQALGPYFNLLLPPPPFDQVRTATVVDALRHAPIAFEQATASLGEGTAAPLASATIALLGGIDDRLVASASALAPILSGAAGGAVVEAATVAATSAAQFRGWLESRLDTMVETTAVGRDAFVWFLRNVALMAETPEELVPMARQEHRRAAVWETVRADRARTVPEPPLPAGADDQVAGEAIAEAQVRSFYEEAGLLGQPDTLRHYLNLPLPDYLEPLTFLGVTDDLTDEDRLDENGISYVPPPGPDLPYFDAANARDPRAGIVHEGAHYQQLAISSRHPDPIRRRFYDSGPNEGIAFYNEELMLQAGLFDDAPHTAAAIYNFARLRALRVEADVKLATGDFSLTEAAAFFEGSVPMDGETAFEESTFYAGNPGQALSYQIGKLQLMRLMTTAIEELGEGFSLRDFHDYVWANGNVPFSLMRWELLGRRDELDVIDADPLGGAPPPSPGFA